MDLHRMKGDFASYYGLSASHGGFFGGSDFGASYFGNGASGFGNVTVYDGPPLKWGANAGSQHKIGTLIDVIEDIEEAKK